MSEFHDDYPAYEMMAHHSEEAGVGKRKKLWGVFWIMLIITIIELVVGFNNSHFSAIMLKIIFIGFTILKAFYIVYAFMHLGDEKRQLKWVIIAPFSCFIVYLAFMVCLGEGEYCMEHRNVMDKQITEQQKSLKEEGHKQGESEHHETETHHE